MIRVLLADDNAVIRSGLASLLALEPDLEVVGEAANGREALTLARERHPDVVLLDVRMPLMDGLEAAGELSGNRRVLMLTYAEDAAIVTAAIKAGASGYLVHGRFTPAELADAVRAVHAGHNVVSPAVAPVLFEALRGEGGDGAPAVAIPAGDRGLTEREAEVLNLMAKGLSNAADRGRAVPVGEDREEPHQPRVREAGRDLAGGGDRGLAGDRRAPARGQPAGRKPVSAADLGPAGPAVWALGPCPRRRRIRTVLNRNRRPCQ